MGKQHYGLKPIQAQNALNELCEYLLGKDYYIVDPLCNAQAGSLESKQISGHIHSLLPFTSRLIRDIMQPQLLDNKIEQTDMPFQEEIEMAKINRAVTIDGVKKWIRANTEQEYAEKLIALCQPVQAKDVPHKKKHRFDDYALDSVYMS